MATSNKTCLYCKAVMELGFVAYLPGSLFTDHLRQNWIEGEPPPSIYQRLKITDRKHGLIVVYRCPDCGFLAHFATSEDNESWIRKLGF